MDTWGLRFRAILNGLLPILIITVLLGGVFLWQHLRHTEQSLLSQGTAAAGQMASVARHPPPEGNRPWLDALALELIEQPGIRGVRLYDSNGTLTAFAGPLQHQGAVVDPAHPPRTAGQHTLPNGTRVLVQPVAPGEGWVEVELLPEYLATRRYRDVLLTVLMLALALAVSFGFTLHIAHHYSRAIQRLRQIVQRLTQRDFSAADDTPPTGAGELDELGRELTAMAESLAAAYDDMQQNVDQSTRDLRETLETLEVQNIELDLARKEALDASRAKSRFLANTSHEIRTPLNGIIGFTNLLLRSPLSAVQSDYLRIIRDSSISLLNIINDILDLSRIEAGKLALEPLPFDLPGLLDDTIGITATSAMDRKLELNLDIEPRLPQRLVGDALRIKQVLLNLLGNALKFTDEGYVTLHVRADDRTDHDALIVFSVTDTGAGLTPEQQQHVFTSFQQGDPSATREHSGTGLGLAIARFLVEQMGGHIDVRSEPGQGSTFWFSLRLPMADHTLHPPHCPQLARTPLTVYEEHPVTRRILHRQLAPQGLRLHWLETPEALAAWLDQSPEEARPRLLLSLPFDADRFAVITAALADADLSRIDTVLAVPPAPIPDTLAQVARTVLHKPVSLERLCVALTDNPASAGSSSLPPPASDTPPLSGTRVLAVDDHPANLKLISTLLTDLGCAVTPAASGEEAIALCREHVFDAILMDIQMPGVDGATAAARIQARERESGGSPTPLLALTAHALPEERRRLLSQGFCAHLTKPVSEDSLLTALRQALGHDGSAAGAPVDDTPATAGTSERTVDLSAALRAANHRPALAEDMLRGLLNSLPESRRAIAEAHRQNDTAALLEAVHHLHGACCYTGAPRLKARAKRLEVALKATPDTDPADAVEALLAALDELADWAEACDLSALFAGA